MCGIYGYFGFQKAGLLAEMGKVIRHRGPDGEGEFTSNIFSMGMRRLSIIDLETGDQPIYTQGGRYVICYNGELYNYIELKEQLLALGYKFKTHSDTEVVVNAYAEWGSDCLQRFNGMFAIAIHDKISQETFFARDRCGQKPFYYWHDEQGKKIVFASEIKALFKCNLVPKQPNLDAFDAYLALRYVPEPRTMFKDINILPAGHFMKLAKNGTKKISRYWDIEIGKINADLSEDDHLQKLESLFFDAVKLTMRSDVPVASYLSAGVDSSLIAYAMTKFGKSVRTYSIGFGSDVDETPEARQTAEIIGTEHHEIICRPEDYTDLQKVVWHMDRPVGDALIMAFYKLAQRASADGKVVLSGEGADEMYAGYSFQKIILLFELYKKFVPNTVNKNFIVPILRNIPVNLLNKFFVFPAFLGTKGKDRIVEFLKNYYGNGVFKNYINLRLLFSQAERNELFTSDFNNKISEKNKPKFDETKQAWLSEGWLPDERNRSGDFLNRLLKIQYDEWLQDWAIIRQEKNSMANSLEVRLPFLDHRLIEHAFTIPAKFKMHGLKDKIIERKLAEKILPKEIAQRTKKPFFMPMEFFFKHKEINNLIQQALDPTLIKQRGYFKPQKIQELQKSMHSKDFITVKQVMALVILELWHQAFDM